MIAGAINRNIDITIFVYIPAQRFKLIFFPLKLPEGCMSSKVKISDNANRLLNLEETEFYEEGASNRNVCFGFQA